MTPHLILAWRENNNAVPRAISVRVIFSTSHRTESKISFALPLFLPSFPKKEKKKKKKECLLDESNERGRRQNEFRQRISSNIRASTRSFFVPPPHNSSYFSSNFPVSRAHNDASLLLRRTNAIAKNIISLRIRTDRGDVRCETTSRIGSHHFLEEKGVEKFRRNVRR